MTRSAGRGRHASARILIAAAAVAAPHAVPAAATASERQTQNAGDEPPPLRREAPVFTYRQFTARLPPLSPSSDDTGPAGAASSEPFAKPAAAASEAPLGQDPPDSGRGFGQAVAAGAARDGRAGVRSEPEGSSPDAPHTEAAVNDRQATVASRQAKPAGKEKSAGQAKLIGRGRASWYQHPGRTANGETYNPDGMTAAHHSLPFGARVKVVNTGNGRSVVVRITDRTNERTKAKRNYAIDLSRGSARKLGIAGVGRVAVYAVN